MLCGTKIDLAQLLADRFGQGDREKVIEFIEMVLVYKFPEMSREKQKSKGKNIWSSRQ